MKPHLLNRCKTCGISWFPRGFDASGKCPNCGSAEVDPTGRFYLLLLVVIAVAAGVFWAKDRSQRPLQGAATPASAPATPRPRRIVQSTPSIPIVPVRITTEAEGKREALRLYPDLAVADSPLNRAFATRFRSYQRLQPEFFQNPAWPVILVKECAAVVGEQQKAAE